MDEMLLHPQRRLVTFSIFYYLPDYRNIINEFVGQEYDLVPSLPRLLAFLTFWDNEIEGPIKLVRVTYPGIKTPHSIRFLDSEYSVN